jgi:uroporphyrinogen decarboxylase
MPYIGEVIQLIRAELPEDIPLIGFGGAPFTLASYAIEGKGSRNYVFVKQLMYGDKPAWDSLMQKMTQCTADYLNYQIESGVQAIQIFDSWMGCLSPADYETYALPYSRAVIDEIKGKVPIIHFGTGNCSLVDLMHQAGAEVLALDWRTPLAATWDRLGCQAIQGNMDPIALCADRDTVHRHAQQVLDEAAGRPGHIFNLGHGIIPETPVENVKALVDYVHEKTSVSL